MPPSSIWAPDILMYNSASESFDSTYQTNVVVTSAGLCTYIPPGIFKSSCPIDITWFPFDDQVCGYFKKKIPENVLVVNLCLVQPCTIRWKMSGQV